MEEYHQLIDRLIDPGYRRMIMHALVNLGHPLSCEMPRCAATARDVFEERGPLRISIDHVEGHMLLGCVDDRPENLRFSHLGCNLAASSTQTRRAFKHEESGVVPKTPLTREQQLIQLQYGKPKKEEEDA